MSAFCAGFFVLHAEAAASIAASSKADFFGCLIP
jgi:hypothetical protein